MADQLSLTLELDPLLREAIDSYFIASTESLLKKISNLQPSATQLLLALGHLQWWARNENHTWSKAQRGLIMLIADLLSQASDLTVDIALRAWLFPAFQESIEHDRWIDRGGVVDKLYSTYSYHHQIVLIEDYVSQMHISNQFARCALVLLGLLVIHVRYTPAHRYVIGVKQMLQLFLKAAPTDYLFFGLQRAREEIRNGRF